VEHYSLTRILNLQPRRVQLGTGTLPGLEIGDIQQVLPKGHAGIHRSERIGLSLRHSRDVDPQASQVDRQISLTRKRVYLRQQYAASLCRTTGGLLQTTLRCPDQAAVGKRDPYCLGKC